MQLGVRWSAPCATAHGLCGRHAIPSLLAAHGKPNNNGSVGVLKVAIGVLVVFICWFCFAY
jgi:hypothetical protein